MSRSKFMNYFTTAKGRSLVFGGTSVLACGLFAGNFLINTIYLQKYKSFVRSYRNGIEREVSDTIIQRFNKAKEILEINDFEERLLSPFVVYGFDVFNAGSTKYKFGAIIGVPSNYFYNHHSDVEKNDIKLKNQPIDWNTSYGKVLEEALVLSEDEQVFGMAREIIQLQSQKILLNSVYPCSTILAVYSIANVLNQRLQLFHRPFAVRGILYSLLAFFGAGMYCFLQDMTQIYYDQETDKQLSNLGIDVVDAGVRFYDKLLKKNVAIRNLTGDSTYSALGNENFLIRHKTLPLTIRKKFFEQKLKELEKLDKSEHSVD